MKHNILSLIALAFPLFVGAATANVNPKPFTVPQIQEWKGGEGQFTPTSATIVTYADPMFQDVAQYASRNIGTAKPQLSKGKASREGIHFILANPKKVGPEAYSMQVTSQGITVQASTSRGAMWAVQSMLQIIEASGSIPCGVATDEPAYPMRGFMIDCGRKYIPLDYLQSLVRTMSYYKMNTLQVHLNDNGFKKYFNDDWSKTYAGFRIQSEFFPGLTSVDGFYTKDEFRQFIREAEALGVEIIPEFDAPAHSLAFTHYRPSLGCEEFGMDHLNLRNPEVTPFLDSLYMEYLGGTDPVFCCPRVHIGTDEYSNKDPQVVELFRSLTDHLIHTVESYGKQAVLWGSLTHAKGETPVKSENVLMDMWYNGYADPAEMKKQGYDMISIPDGYVYIVPEAGYYYNYLNCRYLYEHWTPAQIGDQLFPERDPQIKGGMFAVWNDVCGNGISVGDIHHRVFPGIQVMSEKTWYAVNDTVGYEQWDRQRNMLGEGPATNELGHTQVSVPVLMPDTQLSSEALSQLGYDYQVDFDITWAAEEEGAALTISPRARFYLSDPIGGWLGFSRDGYLFTFLYKGRVGKSEHITIVGTNKSTTLLVDGRKVEELAYDQRLAADAKPFRIIRTLVFPLNRSGNFHSSVTNFKTQKL